MKTLYWKLAWHGIYKNQKIYLPFLLTSIGITMMYYIVSYLTYSKATEPQMKSRYVAKITSTTARKNIEKAAIGC